MTRQRGAGIRISSAVALLAATTAGCDLFQDPDRLPETIEESCQQADLDPGVTEQQARQAKDRHGTDILEEHPSVHAVGASECNGHWVIRVIADEDMPPEDRFSHLDGVPVAWRLGGPIVPFTSSRLSHHHSAETTIALGEAGLPGQGRR
ncbi:hypothetical protein [Haloechinothrix sp. LS1_15]|uniref:hypothetical protein n=1 Tax=Haloechinothrix sp. LS1_15 TaxID=2652248 RepID=UPI0029482423|nr:hypothetical protein [Haloechinothrix sp. LS1_15]MDV6013969.1 hypothetical protein [Haloechinothrix sp. LS1_15]